MKSDTPIYRSIALDLSQRIINDEFPEGTKISGRSLLSGHYNVSPETIRKAIALLKDEQVVTVSQGKEVEVTSVDNAYKFIEHYKSTESVYSLRQDLEILLRQKREIDDRLETILSDIINYSDRLRNLTPYNPVEIEIPPHSLVEGKTVGQIKLWQHTGATLVAIRRGTDILISPGPNVPILAHDRIVVVGNEDVLTQTSQYVQRKRS
jgi:K+/H+ antiporter YhaU regulatory subunit KhtT